MLYEESYWTPHTFAVSDALDWLAQLVYHIPKLDSEALEGRLSTGYPIETYI